MLTWHKRPSSRQRFFFPIFYAKQNKKKIVHIFVGPGSRSGSGGSGYGSRSGSEPGIFRKVPISRENLEI